MACLIVATSRNAIELRQNPEKPEQIAVNATGSHCPCLPEQMLSCNDLRVSRAGLARRVGSVAMPPAVASLLNAELLSDIRDPPPVAHLVRIPNFFRWSVHRSIGCPATGWKLASSPLLQAVR